jgi:hypothetical protein
MGTRYRDYPLNYFFNLFKPRLTMSTLFFSADHPYWELHPDNPARQPLPEPEMVWCDMCCERFELDEMVPFGKVYICESCAQSEGLSDSNPICSSIGCQNLATETLYKKPYCKLCADIVKPELIQAIQKEATICAR